MTKNIITAILVGGLILSIAYAYTQQIAAGKAMTQAEINMATAVAAQREAARMESLANQNAAEAARLEKELNNCVGKK